MSVLIGGLVEASSPNYLTSGDAIPIQRDGFTYQTNIKTDNGPDSLVLLDDTGAMPAVESNNIIVTDPSTSSNTGLYTALSDIWNSSSRSIDYLPSASSPNYIVTTDNIAIERGSINYKSFLKTDNLANSLLLLDGSGDMPDVDIGALAYTSPLANAVEETLAHKLSESVSIADFGAVGNGITDDTTAIQNALNASKNIIVPAGYTCLISNTITIPHGTTLQFEVSRGNVTTPYSYFIMSSTMTVDGILATTSSVIRGGGIVGQVGNTGQGLHISGNGITVYDFFVTGAGSNGIRIGSSAFNCNSCYLTNVQSLSNGGYGIYIHDATSSPANANACSVANCITSSNTLDGIRIGHAYWTLITDHLSEGNGGYGIYLDGTDDGTGVPNCRYATVIGGDFNEGNITGVSYDQSYFSTWINPDRSSLPTQSPGSLSGSGLYNTIGGRGSIFRGIQCLTYPSNFITTQADNGGSNNARPLVINGYSANTAGLGTGLVFQLQRTTGGAYHDAAYMTCYQESSTYDAISWAANNGGTMSVLMQLSPTSNALLAGTASSQTLGTSSFRWGGVYTTTVNASSTVTTTSGLIIGSGNTLDNYVRGTFTPVLTCATPGDLSLTYNTQQGYYTRIGNQITVGIVIKTSSFSYTTATGQINITGLPYTAGTELVSNAGTCTFYGINKATFTQINTFVAQSTNTIGLVANGMNVTQAAVNITDCPTGGTVFIQGTLTYFV